MLTINRYAFNYLSIIMSGLNGFNCRRKADQDQERPGLCRKPSSSFFTAGRLAVRLTESNTGDKNSYYYSEVFFMVDMQI